MSVWLKSSIANDRRVEFGTFVVWACNLVGIVAMRLPGWEEVQMSLEHVDDDILINSIH